MMREYKIFSIFAKILTANRRGMDKKGFLYRVFDLYYDGFRNMKLGRTLWTIILIKLFIMFAILKVFFFPNFLKEHANEGEEPDYVATEMIDRAQ
jgi:hypothetical protein